MRIALFCAAGMSTSMLVEKMKKAAADKGIDVTINAYPESDMEARSGEIDVALLGPQVRYLLTKAKGILEPKGVQVDAINSIDYGMMKGDKVLEAAIALAKK